VNKVKRLAFDHKLILDTCLQRLREKVMEQPVVFHLLPEKFSLRELQDLYEAILGVDLDRRNFRKRIILKDWLVDLNEMEEDVPHRPGKLYKLRPGLKKNGRQATKSEQKITI
jgi:8-oxo-dGTP diphosphatase